MIEVKNLYKSFGKLEVLKGISETIQDQEVVCVIGPSGSGKSTFLRCLNLLEEPTSGVIMVDGVEITQLEYVINADKSYVVTYSQTDEYYRMDEFEASAATIELELEN